MEGGNETLLIVDDEDMLRMAVSKLMDRLGYTVLTANNGKEAVEICRDHRGSIDLVLLDMIMPEMNGIEAFWQIRAVRPEAQVIMFSGYERDAQVDEIIQGGAYAFLEKPVASSVLADTIRQALDARESN